jgi:hypothetical protein
MKKLFALIAAAIVLAGCGRVWVKGTANTFSQAPLSINGKTFIMEEQRNPDAIGTKVGQLIARAFEIKGLKHVPDNYDYVIRYAYDVVGDGVDSSAYSTLINPNTTYATVATNIVNTSLYKKTIAVGIWNKDMTKRLWDGVTSETGWCNQIIVTTPHIMSVMLNNFPETRTNDTASLGEDDPFAQEVRKFFPSSTNWSCR